MAKAKQNTNTQDSIKHYLLDDIEVKSPKEVPLAKEVPASISLISAQKIADNEVHSLSDISATVPNFYMIDYGSKLQSPVFIRGIGSKLGTPSVGLYVDNVPYFEKTTFGFDFYDIERIEVLRGPQGTLYGRNTMGGIINIYSKSPLYYKGTNILATAGNHGYYNVNINHYNKLSDKVGFSINGNYNKLNGYYTNRFDGKSADDEYSLSGRTRFVWKISDKITLENIASYEKSKQNGFPYAHYDVSDNKAGDINYNQESSYKLDLFSDGLVLKYQNRAFELLSTTSYQYYDGTMAVDQDFTADSLYFFNIGDRQNMVSQEVVAKSHSKSRYNWLVGVDAFYQKKKQHTTGDIYSYKMKQDICSNFKTSGLAFFHQSTLSDIFTKGLTLTAGIRLDIEKDKLEYVLNQAIGNAQMSQNNPSNYEETFTQVMPKVAVKYKINQVLNTYATVSKGYKSGGFNTNSSIDLEENRSYDPENSWNYELGFKSSMLNNRLFIDAAVFYIDWNDQQIDVPVPTGRGNMKTNAGKSESKGFELFAKALPGKNWEATLSYGYTHATFTDYVVSDELNYNDNFVPYVPRSTVNAGLKKTITIKTGCLNKIIANLSYRGTGKHYWNLNNSISQDYYGLVDGKLSFVSGKFQLDIWGKNILDESYNSYYFIVSSTGDSFVQTGRPVTFGVNLKLNL